MSFEMVCKNCGAVSSPSVGVCPFCKTVFTAGDHGDEAPGLNGIIQLYAEGKLEKALSLLAATAKEKPQLDEDVSFLILQVKIWLETEGPMAKIQAALSKAFILAPQNREVAEYQELMDAKEKLEPGVRNDLGEQALKNLLRKSPENVHALFLMGTHLFWSLKETSQSAQYLQRCVDLRPVFLRAWACLGMIYKTTDHPEQATRAFRKCIELETHPQMVSYFEKMIPRVA